MSDIGWAVKQMRDGARVRRMGWNGKGMDLHLEDGLGDLHQSHRLPFVVIHTADDKFVPWLCSQTDLLATDWERADG